MPGGVFFTGGDQKRITKAIKAPTGRTLRSWTPCGRYIAAAASSPAQARGGRARRVMFSDPGTVLTTLKQGVKLGKEIDEGLGFLNHAWFIEQHCMTRGRFAQPWSPCTRKA